MLGWLALALATEPRDACAAGDDVACDALATDLAVRLGAYLTEHERHPRTHELWGLLMGRREWRREEDAPSHVPCDVGARCGPSPRTRPLPWSIVGEAYEEAGWTRLLRGPRGPRVLVGPGGGVTLLPQVWCQAQFTTSRPATVVGIGGPDCDRFLHVGLDGMLLADLPMPVEAHGVVSDGQTHAFADSDRVFDIGGRQLGPARRLLGVAAGEVLFEGPMGPPRTVTGAGETVVDARCRWSSEGWVCSDRGLLWRLEGDELAGPVDPAPRPEPVGDVVVPSGETRLYLRSSRPGRAVVQRAPPQVLGLMVERRRPLSFPHVVADIQVDEDWGEPILLPSGPTLVNGHALRLLPGDVYIDMEPLPETRIRVTDPRGRAVVGAVVRSDLGEGVSDRRGEVRLPCRERLHGMESDRMGWADCSEDALVLDEHRPVCTVEGTQMPCDALHELPSDAVYRGTDRFELTRQVIPAIETVPRSRFELEAEGRDFDGYATPGESLALRSGSMCGVVAASEELQTVPLSLCRPVAWRQLVDAVGEPYGGRPDGFAYVHYPAGSEVPEDMQRPPQLVLPAVTTGPVPDALVALVGVWYGPEGRWEVHPDGTVMGPQGTWRVERSLPGVLTLRSWSRRTGERRMWIPLADGRVYGWDGEGGDDWLASYLPR